MTTFSPVHSRFILPAKRSKCIKHRLEFSSLRQMVEWGGDKEAQRWRPLEKCSSHEEDHDHSEFSGAKSYAHAQAMATNGWAEGRSMIKRNLGAISLATEIDTVPTFCYDVAGMMPDVPMAIAGDPACMLSPNPLKPTKAPVLRFVLSVAVSAIWDVKPLMRWGAAILSVIDTIESGGQAVQLDCDMSLVSVCGRRRVQSITRIKTPGHHIDFDVMAFAIAHPAMLRRIGFGVFERIVDDDMYDHMSSCYGRPDEPDFDGLDTGIVHHIPSTQYSGLESIIQKGSDQELYDGVMQGMVRLMEGEPFKKKS